MSSLFSERYSERVWVRLLLTTTIICKYTQGFTQCQDRNLRYSRCHLNHKENMILWCDNSNLTSVPIPHPTNTLIESQTFPNSSRSIHFNHTCLHSLNPEVFAYYPELRNFIANDNDVTQVVGHTFLYNIKLRKLVLARNRIHTIDDQAFAGLEELRHLDLRGNQMQTINKKMLEHLPNLLFLDLSSNRIRKLHVHSFLRLHHLQHLDLSNNKLRQVVPLLLQGNGELRVFNLRNNDVTGFPDNFFQYNVNLQRVDISLNNMSCISGDTFQNNTNLTEVLLFDNNLRIPNKRWFENIPRVRDPEVERPLEENPWHCDCDSREYYIFLNSLASSNRWKRALDIRCSSPYPHQDRLLSKLPRSVFEKCENLPSPPTDCVVIPRQPLDGEDLENIGEDDYDETTATSQKTTIKPQPKPVVANDQDFNLVYFALAFLSGILFGGILLCFFMLRKYRCQKIEKNESKLKDGEPLNVNNSNLNVNNSHRIMRGNILSNGVAKNDLVNHISSHPKRNPSNTSCSISLPSNDVTKPMMTCQQEVKMGIILENRSDQCFQV